MEITERGVAGVIRTDAFSKSPCETTATGRRWDPFFPSPSAKAKADHPDMRRAKVKVGHLPEKVLAKEDLLERAVLPEKAAATEGAEADNRARAVSTSWFLGSGFAGDAV